MIVNLGTFKLKDKENRQVIQFKPAPEDVKGIHAKDIKTFSVVKVRGQNNTVELILDVMPEVEPVATAETEVNEGGGKKLTLSLDDKEEVKEVCG